MISQNDATSEWIFPWVECLPLTLTWYVSSKWKKIKRHYTYYKSTLKYAFGFLKWKFIFLFRIITESPVSISVTFDRQTLKFIGQMSDDRRKFAPQAWGLGRKRESNQSNKERYSTESRKYETPHEYTYNKVYLPHFLELCNFRTLVRRSKPSFNTYNSVSSTAPKKDCDSTQWCYSVEMLSINANSCALV